MAFVVRSCRKCGCLDRLAAGRYLCVSFVLPRGLIVLAALRCSRRRVRSRFLRDVRPFGELDPDRPGLASYSTEFAVVLEIRGVQGLFRSDIRRVRWGAAERLRSLAGA